MHLNGEKWLNAIKWVKLTGNRQIDRKLMFMETFGPRGLSAHAPGL